jgi:hypothetical protein
MASTGSSPSDELAPPHPDLGAVIARSSGGAASQALDAARSQAVGLDRFIDRWVQRTIRRKHPAPVAPRGLLDGEARR